MKNDDAKSFYNEKMPEKFGADYEYHRWHRNPIQKAGFDQTLRAIGRHVLSDQGLNPVRILELGPGAGTWTKYLRNRFPAAYLDLVDISREMLDRARSVLGEDESLRYIEADITEWKPEGKYDFFFSSRVLEYITDKQAFTKKVSEILSPGGRGFVITKMPHYRREKMLGKIQSGFHQGQISPGILRKHLSLSGFCDVDCYPVTLSLPFVGSPHANRMLGKLFGPHRLGPLGSIFAESYAVVFRKPYDDYIELS